MKKFQQKGIPATPKKAEKASDSNISTSGGGFDGLPREYITQKITPILIKKMSSSNWKIRMESIESVNKILEEANKCVQPTATVELFAALGDRLYDSKKDLIMATLATVCGVAATMGPMVEKSSKAILSDVLKCLNATIYLPCLIEKSGHNIGEVREKMRELTKHIAHLYSPSKSFPYILEGLRSKNNRTRIECISLVGFLMDHHGAEVSGQAKCLHLVAVLTSERDGDIRKAALNTLVIGYKNLGDDIWRYLGNLTDAQRSMLDEKFKWKAKEIARRREGNPGDARAALRQSVRDNGKNVSHPELSVDRHPVSHSVASPNSKTGWNEALDIIAFGSPDQSVDGIKSICYELALATNDPESSAMDEFVKDSDKLVLVLATKVAKTFDFSLAGATSRSCKYVLNALMQIFQKERLAHAVKENTLQSLSIELLFWLSDERVPLMDDGSQLLKAMNVLMIKMLDNMESTSSFVVLINLLQPLDPARWPSPAAIEIDAARNQKFLELVVKCLIKVTKKLSSIVNEVDVDRILLSIHVYLEELGMEEIRKKAGAEYRPLRMIKTLLFELVKALGTAINDHLSMVPVDMKPPPIILAYIDLNLQELLKNSANNSPLPATHSADAQMKVTDTHHSCRSSLLCKLRSDVPNVQHISKLI